MTVDFVWSTTPEQFFTNIKEKIDAKCMRIACNYAAVPLKDEIVNRTPVDTGTLKKSWRIKVNRFRDGKGWAVVIGPKAGLRKTYKRTGRTLVPGRYNPLVDRGTRYFTGRHQVTDVRPKVNTVFFDRFFDKLQQLSGFKFQKNA